MAKGFRFASIICVLLFLSTGLIGQSDSYNKLYKPLSLVKRLSYENFRNLKMLRSAIINYGGGVAEFDKLVDQYAEASALYFQDRISESAKKFSLNERSILKMAKKLAKIYKNDSSKMLTDGMKLNIKNQMKRSFNNKKINGAADHFISNAKYGVRKANDYYVRYINASTASPRQLITAIFYYRRSKENVINMYESMTDLDKDTKEKIRNQFKKDRIDNSNKIYKARKKGN